MISRGSIVVLALIFVAAYMAEAQVVTDGLICYWTFDEADIDGDTAKDLMGGNDGTIFGDPETVEGQVNQALEFAGNNDYLEVDLPDESLAGGATLELWFRQDSPTGWAALIKILDAIEISMADGPIEVWSSVGRVGPEDVLSDGNWHHVAVPISDTKIMMYVDGENKGETAGNLPLGKGERNIGGIPGVTFGKDRGGSGWFIGIMDEFRIYDRPLSAEEVQQNMAAKGMSAVEPADKLAETWGKIKVSR